MGAQRRGREDLARGQIAVGLLAEGGAEVLARALRALLDHTDPTAALLVSLPTGGDPALERLLAEVRAAHPERGIAAPPAPADASPAARAQALADSAAPADVVIVRGDVAVAEGWLEGLAAAAYGDSTLASATPLTRDASTLAVHPRLAPPRRLPADTSLEALARRLRERSPRLRPRLPTAFDHCVLMRRDALELAGGLDPAFADLGDALVDWSQRCVRRGLGHVAADDVLVAREPRPAGQQAPALDLRQGPGALVAERHPFVRRAFDSLIDDHQAPVWRALSAARAAVDGMSVTVDARSLGPTVGGTQTYTLQLIGALAAREDLHVRVVLPEQVGRYARRALDALPEVERLAAADVGDGTPRTAVVHRPQQVFDAADLDVVRHLGDRLVITHQDLIAYRNPGYFAGPEEWLHHRRITRQALAQADRVVFFSAHALRDALADELVEEPHAAVVPIGLDPVADDERSAPERPAALAADPPEPFLLALGADYRHKNRPFALDLLHELRAGGWPGGLVLAGPHVPYGSSAGEEAARLATDPDLARHVVDLPAVTEAEKAWLLKRAAAVACPTVYEGFGLIPFEAAQAGVPALFALSASLAETLPERVATLVPWDAAASAPRVAPLLTDARARAEHVEAVRAAARSLTWERAAGALADVYEDALRAPFRAAQAVAGERFDQEKAIPHFRGEAETAWEAYRSLREDVGDAGMSLVGPEGTLPADVRGALVAVTARRWPRRLLFAALRALRRAR
ncbi:MAG TPA: glycosyltransferase [Solirubrobacteraceae bacterium]|nr:glycosyltransferase [Solirubrobacteraceae bacterium]